MSIRDKAVAALAFRTIPVTVAVLLVYVAVYIAVFVTDDLPPVPPQKHQHGLNLDEAYQDLHHIAGIAHPYNSHQNDIVRNFILKRVNKVAGDSKIVHVSDDQTTNVTFSRSLNGLAAYFESLNVVVKIDGSKPDLDGILFSAHFDSVSTAPGATDDGMGVATIVQLVEYFSKNQPKRTVVFNINDAEEDGLYGAQVFLEHPWFNLTKSFINVEGAGSGGRPLLLRATSTKMAKAFSKVQHPHGNAISADAFARGVVKSSTDYTVYTAAKLQGLDFSFYRRRSKYHTKDDSVPSLGGKAALWNMMESTLTAGKALANDESSDDDKSVPVYFDIFGEAMGVASKRTFLVINIVLLAVCPIIIGLLIFAAYRKRKLYWYKRGWGRFPASLIVSAGLTFGLAWAFSALNPFVVYSSVNTVLLACLATSYIGVHATVHLLDHFRPIPQQRSVILVEAYVVWWMFLLVDTILIGSKQLGGLYFVTFFYSATTAALIVGLLEHFELPERVRSNRSTADAGQQSREDEEPNERTPLVQNGRHAKTSDVDESNELGLWFIQLLLAVPFPLILISQVALMLINALNQTLVDGSPAIVVYMGVAFVSLLSFLPLAPFAHKIHRLVAVGALIIVIITLVYNVFAFPYSTNAPFKVFFQQEINLDTNDNIVTLSGMNPWLSRDIVPEIPSSWGQDIKCGPDPIRSDIPSCKWQSLPPSVAPGPSKDWISVKTNLLSPGSGQIFVSGANTRSCRLYFDVHISTAHVNGSNGHVQPLFPFPSDGINELRLWSRSWDHGFEVNVTWDGSAGLAGRAACEWAEEGNIPALTEILGFLPPWARVTKRTDGLVEGWKAFSL